MIRFTKRLTGARFYQTEEILVLKIWNDAVGGLRRARSPVIIRNEDIIGAERIDAGPYAPPDPLVRTYFGHAADRAMLFQGEAAVLHNLGYEPAAQTVNEGHHGAGTILLCFLLIGFLILLMSKPAGSLTVTYRRVDEAPTVVPEATKPCPRCAETIKAAAVACRYCGYEYVAA